jgi:membrane protein
VDVLDRVLSGLEDRLNRARRRSPGFDHFARALGRYTDVLGGRLAAAIAYYGFFAVFALGLVAYSIFRAVLRESLVVSEAVADFLALNLPFLAPDQIRESGGRVGVIGLLLLVITGIGWVEAIRSSQRLIYDLDQQPGYVVIRQLVDLAVLVGVFLLLGLSIGAVDALSSLLAWIFGERSLISSVSGWILAVVINMVLATLLLVAVPRLRMTPRRLVMPVVLVGIGITLLNTVGRYYVVRMERNPAYTVVAGAVGLLIYLYLFNQLLLFGAAIAATSRHGRAIDLTTGRDAPDPSGGGVGVAWSRRCQNRAEESG